MNKLILFVLQLLPATVVLSVISNKPKISPEGAYPFWGEYHKTPIPEIKPDIWLNYDTIITCWDWSFPNTVKPSPKAFLCIARNFGLGKSKIDQLPEFHSRYIKFIKALGESGIPQMEEVKGLFLGDASPSNGDEGIGPFPEGNAEGNDTVQHVIKRIDAWAEA